MQNTPVQFPTLRRRDFLKWSVAAVAGYALVKGGVQAFSFRPAEGPWRNLSPSQARIFTAAALAIVGPTGQSLYRKAAWNPAADFDNLLERVAADQRQMMQTGLALFEHWTLLGGFSTLSEPRQLAHLAAWQTSRIPLRRSVWGLLHAAASVSFSSRSGWDLMQYPGPCLPTAGTKGRAPGQSARFDWDPKVP